MQLFANTNLNFIGNRKIGYVISSALIILGLGSLLFRGGPNYGVDFIGGISIRVQFIQAVDVDAVRTSISELGYGNAEIKKSSIQNSNGETVEEFIIRVLSSVEGNSGEEIMSHLKQQFGEENVNRRSIDTVGPKIGGELRQAAIYSILFAIFGILGYVRIRFKGLRFAVGAIIPLFHDVFITLGVFVLLDYEISLPVVAAFLTIVGYSLNDTIVVFDRIRENLIVLRREVYVNIINRSINETLSRTIVTSLTTFMVVLVLFLYGGDVIHSFAFALLIGIIIGTYSSIFVASPILVEWEERKSKRSGTPATRNKR